MSGFAKFFLFILAVVGAGAYAYWQFHGGRESQVIRSTNTSTTSAPTKAATDVRFPVDEEAGPEAPIKETRHAQLPVNTKSLEASLTEIFGAPVLTSVLRLDNLVRNVAVVVTEESSQRLPSQFLPWTPVGVFLADNKYDGTFNLSPLNGARYERYVRALEMASAKKLVEIYVHFYSLFQAAYEESGSRGYFNDKVISAIDDLLHAPEPEPPLRLVRPEVFYRFADPELEALSAGQKLMIRLGLEKERRVKKSLREYRALLTHLSKKSVRQ